MTTPADVRRRLLPEAREVRDALEEDFPGYRFEVDILGFGRGMIVRAFDRAGLRCYEALDLQPYERADLSERLRSARRWPDLGV